MRGLAVLILAALFAFVGYATYALGDQPAVPRCATPAVMSSYDGRACIIAVGERWAAIPEREAARQR